MQHSPVGPLQCTVMCLKNLARPMCAAEEGRPRAARGWLAGSAAHAAVQSPEPCWDTSCAQSLQLSNL